MAVCADETTVREMRAWLAEPLAQTPKLEGVALLESQAGGERRSCLFLAMLDLTFTGDASLEQAETFGPFRVRREEAAR